MRLIKSGNQKIALQFNPRDIKKGLSFFTEEDDFIQVGTWRYERGKRLDAHTHNVVKRDAARTQEFIYVVKGKTKVFVYNEDEKLIEELTLSPNEGMIFFSGGHGYEILEDDTVIIESKNGPYPGVEVDKKKFGKNK